MSKKAKMSVFAVLASMFLNWPVMNVFAADGTVLKTLELKSEPATQTITVPGSFRLVFKKNSRILTNPGEHGARGTKINELYDLETDPEGKNNYCSVNYDVAGSSIEAGKMKVLESSPVRVIIRVAGTLGTAFEEKVNTTKKYVIYPTGKVYIREYYESEPRMVLAGMWLNPVYSFIPAEQFADPVEDENFWWSWGGQKYLADYKLNKRSYFELFYGTDKHPKFFTDKSPKKTQSDIEILETKSNFFIALHYCSERVYYWGRWVMGRKIGDLNIGFSQSPFKGYDLKDSKTLTYLFQMKPNSMSGTKAAEPYAADYRNPGALTVTKGSPVLDDEDDLNKDGYNEAEGCYLVKAAVDGAEFTLDCKKKRFDPVFKVEEWNAVAPESIEVNGAKLIRGTGYLAEVPEGSKDLIIQVAGSYDKILAIKIIKKQ